MGNSAAELVVCRDRLEAAMPVDGRLIAVRAGLTAGLAAIAARFRFTW